MAADRIELRGITSSRMDATELLTRPGDVVVVERGSPRLLVMLCPDGCGEELVINLDRRTGPAWSLYRSRWGLSVYPSIWRDTGCKSHFVIWNDHILLFVRGDADWSEPIDDDLLERVESALSPTVERHFLELADELEEVPWTVLAACRLLVRLNRARAGDALGTFAKSA